MIFPIGRSIVRSGVGHGFFLWSKPDRSTKSLCNVLGEQYHLELVHVRSRLFESECKLLGLYRFRLNPMTEHVCQC